MARLTILWLLVLALLPAGLQAREVVRVQAGAALIDSGLMDHVLPRFGLKHGVGTELVAKDGDVTLGQSGTLAFDGPQEQWSVQAHSPAGQAFADWLTSDIGIRTVERYAPEGTALYARATIRAAAAPEVTFEGDVDLGLEVSRRACGRCHVVEAARRFGGIGSTPSFMALRALDDWPRRFAEFFVLNPHPAVSQVEDLSAPFAPERPPPMVPVEITLAEYEAMLAYVASLTPADLGAPVQHQ